MNEKPLCFQDFIKWHSRSGGALVAESNISSNLEARFGRLYVPHVSDIEILYTIHKNASERAFLVEIVGIPGVGKTKFLKELILGLRPEIFPSKDRTTISQINQIFDFRDIEVLGSSEPKSGSKNSKKKVWVTLNIDEFVSTSPGSNPLNELYLKLKKSLPKGESLIIAGNIGVLENEEAKKSISEIRKLMGLRNQKEINLIRFPSHPSLYWTKEFGVEIKKFGCEGDPYFLVSGKKGFQDYSLNLIKLCRKVIEECASKEINSFECKKCIVHLYVEYLEEIKQLMEKTDFSDRLHDLLQFLWLKNADLYIVARALNIFWSNALEKLWHAVEKEGQNATICVDKSLIYASVYRSKIPSIYRVGEYYVSDSNIHRLRNRKIEQELLQNDRQICNDPVFRLRKRLEYFFERSRNDGYKKEIYGGVFEEFTNEARLTRCLTEIMKKLVLIRLHKSLLYIPENDKRYLELFREPWGFSRLLFATKISTKASASRTSGIKHVMLFHESVLNDIDIQSGISFEEVQSPSYYLVNREKILRLKLRLGSNSPNYLQEKAPSLHLGLSNYASLRELTRGTGKPDIDLDESTQTKVYSFLEGLEGFVTHQIRPLIWNYLKNDLQMKDSSRIIVRTAGLDTQRCNLNIEGKQLVFGLEGSPFLKISVGELP